MSTVPVRIPTRDLGRVILGPCVPCTAILAVLSTSFMVSYVVGICNTPKTKFEGLFRIFCLSLGLSFHFVWYCLSIYSQISFVIFETLNDVKWRKRTGKKTQPCLFLSKNGTFSRRKGSTSFLKSLKVTNRSKINICKKCLAI